MSSVREKFDIESVGMLEVNCYLVPVPESGKLYIIDPGSEADNIIKKAAGFDYDEAIILLTHAHVDHISATREVMDSLSVKTVCLHPDDFPLYKSPDNHLMPFVPPAKDLPEPIAAKDTDDFEIIHTPGHTMGGVCYYFKKLPALFSGDTIFSSSIGRSDLPGGNAETLLRSIKEKILTLPENLEVFPGHGPSTSIGAERKGNPFL